MLNDFSLMNGIVLKIKLFRIIIYVYFKKFFKIIFFGFDYMFNFIRYVGRIYFFLMKLFNDLSFLRNDKEYMYYIKIKYFCFVLYLEF